MPDDQREADRRSCVSHVGGGRIRMLSPPSSTVYERGAISIAASCSVSSSATGNKNGMLGSVLAAATGGACE